MMYSAERDIVVNLLQDIKTGNFLETSSAEVVLKVSDEHILATPTGSHQSRLNVRKEDLVIMDINGN